MSDDTKREYPDTFDLVTVFSEQAIRIKTIELAINAAQERDNPHEPAVTLTEADIVNTLTPILEVHQKARELTEPEPDTSQP